MPKEKKEIMVAAQVTPTLRKELEDYAEKRDMPLSMVLRLALVQFLAREAA